MRASIPVFHLRHLASRLVDAIYVVDLDSDVDRCVGRVGQEVGPAHGALAQTQLRPDVVLGHNLIKKNLGLKNYQTFVLRYAALTKRSKMGALLRDQINASADA